MTNSRVFNVCVCARARVVINSLLRNCVMDYVTKEITRVHSIVLMSVRSKAPLVHDRARAAAAQAQAVESEFHASSKTCAKNRPNGSTSPIY